MAKIQASIEELSTAETEFGDHVSKRKQQIEELKDQLEQVPLVVFCIEAFFIN